MMPGNGPELPEPVAKLGEQLAGGAVAAPPELFTARDVFVAELARIFTRPWLAVEHASRLGEDGQWFRFDVAGRSVLVVRECAEAVHALRNVCLHAGYRVCEEEDGRSERLLCRYHGWEYALDGLLTEPLLKPEKTDRSRYRLPRYPMRVVRGLIVVDLSAPAPTPLPPTAPVDENAIPAALEGAVVSGRRRYATTWNWKPLRQLLRAAPELVFGAGGALTELGPLSFLALREERAALLRIVPKFPGHTDLEVIRMAPPGVIEEPGPDYVAETLRNADGAVAGDPGHSLDPTFFAWYWGLMSAPPVTSSGSA